MDPDGNAPERKVSLEPVVSKQSRDLSMVFLCRAWDIRSRCGSRRKCSRVGGVDQRSGLRWLGAVLPLNGEMAVQIT